MYIQLMLIAEADQNYCDQTESIDHELVILFPFSIPSWKKREEGKANELAKIVIKSHAYQSGQLLLQCSGEPPAFGFKSLTIRQCPSKNERINKNHAPNCHYILLYTFRRARNSFCFDISCFSIVQKDITFDHDFCYFILLFSSFL